jgi:hypothetical protein
VDHHRYRSAQCHDEHRGPIRRLILCFEAIYGMSSSSVPGLFGKVPWATVSNREDVIVWHSKPSPSASASSYGGVVTSRILPVRVFPR